jgi:hypothetical protein
MTRTNSDRIATGRRLVETWRTLVGEIEDESNSRDAMTDILHAIAADGRDFEAEARMALDNLTDELDPGDRCTIVCTRPDGHDGPCSTS